MNVAAAGLAENATPARALPNRPALLAAAPAGAMMPSATASASAHPSPRAR
jgi:hypothetical protein